MIKKCLFIKYVYKNIYIPKESLKKKKYAPSIKKSIEHWKIYKKLWDRCN